MTRPNPLDARTSAWPAIAAALAIYSTPALAQEAAQQTQPVTTEPATTTQPAPITEQAAPIADSSATTPASKSSSAQTRTATTRTVKRTTRTAAAKPAPVRTVTRTSPTHAAAPAAAAAATAKPPAAPAPAQSAVVPAVRFTPKPAPQQSSASGPINLSGDTVPIAAGGALALLALGGAVAAISGRRRRRREQELADAETMSHEPFEMAPEAQPAPAVPDQQPQVVAPAASAFAWGNQTSRAAETTTAQNDRRPGETWVERAYRGPTANNPSVSLRNRLKRAAFFDKREREAAAGTAQPVSANAGLPGAMAGERELA